MHGLPMSGPSFPVVLHRAATHLPVAPGGTIVVTGSFRSRHDGSLIDGASTTWPADAPGGASVDAGGIIDFRAGGFDVASVDAKTHVIEAVASGEPAAGCAAYRVPAPCLIVRSHDLAHGRLLTVGDWASSLRGGMQVEVLAPIAPASAAAEAPPPPVALLGGAAAAVVAMVLAVAWWLHRRWRRSPRGRLGRLLRQLGRLASRVDPVLGRVLRPALASTARAIRQRRLDPTSTEGQRLEQALRQLQAELRHDAARKRRAAEREVADELAEQVMIALEAAAEASGAA